MIDTYPPAAAIAWAAGTAGPEASASVVRRLAGGIHAATHLLRTERPSGDLVLRRYPPGDDAAGREAEVLRALDGLAGLAPRLVAADPDGTRFGQPATLITRLPGHADIIPDSPLAAAGQLGRLLARVHAAPVTGLRDGMAVASGGRGDGPAPGTAVLEADGHRLAGQPAVLTHFDFWSGNVLWDHGKLTGVVDWSGAARAPRGLDVSWCRLDLVLLHGRDAADAFLGAYERKAATVVPELELWDLFALTHSHHSVETWLPNYHDLGRTDLTTAGLRERHTWWTRDRLARYGKQLSA